MSSIVRPAPNTDRSHPHPPYLTLCCLTTLPCNPCQHSHHTPADGSQDSTTSHPSHPHQAFCALTPTLLAAEPCAVMAPFNTTKALYGIFTSKVAIETHLLLATAAAAAAGHALGTPLGRPTRPPLSPVPPAVPLAQATSSCDRAVGGDRPSRPPHLSAGRFTLFLFSVIETQGHFISSACMCR
ncbi:hypothetical protein E2C01_050248 [Portunus trituberculatus]|uniref:Uncharacterized protein n=1 Tax=Portunus trituberculatus TaxID=210409 RepID=A0A5B7GIE6_PORTR|nr:hypothetical protein [Portunus trituberculatus]